MSSILMPTGIMLSMFLSLSSSWSTSTKKRCPYPGVYASDFPRPRRANHAPPSSSASPAPTMPSTEAPVLASPPLLALVDAPDGLLGSEPPALPPGPDAPGDFGESEGSDGSFGSFGSFGS